MADVLLGRRAECHAALGDTPAARADFAAAIEGDPGNAAHYLVARAHFEDARMPKIGKGENGAGHHAVTIEFSRHASNTKTLHNHPEDFRYNQSRECFHSAVL